MSDDTNRERSARCLLCNSSALQVTYQDPKGKMVTSDCKPWSYAATIVVCRTCGHLQKLVDDELRSQTKAAYSQYDLYHLSDGGEQLLFDVRPEHPKTRSARILDRLRQFLDLPDSGAMLDVGCGNGAMLQTFGKVCPKWTLFGHEQNARYRTRVMELPGVNGFYEDRLDVIEREFDMVTLIHVLEHVSNPQDLLNDLKGRLATNGLLLIQVPDAIANPFDVIVIDHFSHFSSTVLDGFMRNLGYQVLCLATDWVDKEISLLVQKGQCTQENPKAAPYISGLVQRYQHQVEWLRLVADDAARHAARAHFGIFGTAIAGTWLGTVLGDDVRFFVDEDSRRIGKSHLGKPILHPDELASGDHVFLAFPYAVAAKVYDRLSSVGRAKYLLPPPL